MPGASRNWILRCSCSQEAVPGANMAVLELQIHWGRLKPRPNLDQTMEGCGNWNSPLHLACFVTQNKASWCSFNWSSVDQKHCSTAEPNMKPVGCRWEILLFQHAEDPQDYCGSSSAFPNSGVRVWPHHYSLISLFTVKKESSFYSSLLHTCFLSVSLKCLRGFSPFWFHRKTQD